MFDYKNYPIGELKEAIIEHMADQKKLRHQICCSKKKLRILEGALVRLEQWRPKVHPDAYPTDVDEKIQEECEDTKSEWEFAETDLQDSMEEEDAMRKLLTEKIEAKKRKAEEDEKKMK